LISLSPLSPTNTPDNLEKEAIQRFIAGETEFARLTTDPPQRYRFIKPLYTEQSCLECHKRTEYAVGNVIGAISVTLPAETILSENRDTQALLILWGFSIICIVVASTYFMTWRLLIKLDKIQTNLVRQATTDELTGLMNRRNILKRLDEELKRAVRLHEHLCIMIIDLDHFKRINDTYGHLFGDVVLKLTAECIKDTVRAYDIVGRIGGEEFLIISPGVEMDVAIGLAERVRKRVSELVFDQGGQKVTVTLSVGATALESSDLGLVSMMKRADRALYQAKEQGRNRVVAL
jgi:diguanylate cyclase (GGDEF)-like protein